MNGTGRWKAVLCVILTIVQMSYIFVMSAQNSEDSSVISAFVSKIVGQFTVGDFRNKTSEEQDNIVSAIDSPLREAAHFIEYAILGILLYLSVYFCFAGRGKESIYLLPASGIGMLYAISDEVHQIFVPGRAFEFFDIAVDISGTVAGALVAFGLIRSAKKKTLTEKHKHP